MAKAGLTHSNVDSDPRIRRGYFESRYGQLHVHNAIPSGGGFDESAPLICVHHSPMSGAAFLPLLALLGRGRSVYAPDLPGYGASDPPAARPTIADYAAAIEDFCGTMRLRQVDVLGYQSGSFVAIELAIARPESTRRLVCIGVPWASEADRDAFRREPWPLVPTEDGRFLTAEWGRTLPARRSGLSLGAAARNLGEVLRNGPHAWWNTQAALDYPVRERLARVTQPTLILRPKDSGWDATQRAAEIIPHARLLDLPEVGEEALETAPQRIAEAVQGFLRG